MKQKLVLSRWTQGMMLASVVLLATVGEISAQQSPSGGGGRGMRYHGGGRGQSFDPVVFEGPPVPDSMAALVSLDGDGLGRYTTMYQNLMESTKSQRDSLATLRQSWRAARDNGGGAADLGGGMGGMREIRQYLADRQQQFDQALEETLTKDQFKRYQAWRDQRRKEAQSEMRNRGGAPGGRDRD
jgi:hypothetical protein